MRCVTEGASRVSKNMFQETVDHFFQSLRLCELTDHLPGEAEQVLVVCHPQEHELLGHAARSGMQWQATAGNDLQHHATACNGMQRFAAACNSMQQHALAHAAPSNGM